MDTREVTVHFFLKIIWSGSRAGADERGPKWKSRKSELVYAIRKREREREIEKKKKKLFRLPWAPRVKLAVVRWIKIFSERCSFPLPCSIELELSIGSRCGTEKRIRLIGSEIEKRSLDIP